MLSRDRTRVARMAVALIAAFPGQAFAHGEQALVFPAATLSLILLTTVALLSWGAEWPHKPLLVATLIGVHATLWFLPLTDPASGAGRMFLALVAVPVGVAMAVHVIITRWRRKDRSELSSLEDV